MMKNIIFDLGGVIINIDYFKTERAFEKAGIKNFGDLFSQMKQSDLFDRLETGKISQSDFCQELRTVSGSKLSDDEIVACWNEMLLDIPAKRLELLDRLKSKYNLFLFSNTNAIHLEAFNEIAQRDHGISSLDHFFITPYYSHIFGHRKPHASSFQKLLDIENLKPEETLFIDDTIIHIEGAKSVGLQTHHLVNKDIVDLF